MGMFANFCRKYLGIRPKSHARQVCPHRRIRYSAIPTTPAASSVSCLFTTSVAPSTPDLESEGPDQSDLRLFWFYA